MAGGAIVAAASYAMGSHRGDVQVDVGLASIASFLFGILMAFTIVRTRERLALVQSLVSKGNASLLSIHRLVEVLSEAERSDIRDLIDSQLIDQIDYLLVDNHLSLTSHLRLVNAIIALEPQTRQEEVVYKEAVEICIDMGSNRAMIEVASGQALSPMEWTGLLLLLLVLMALIAALPGGILWGALVAGVMAGTLVTLVILLRKLDLLRWHERTSIWEPTARLFRSMGRDPYVPREVIGRGRYRPIGPIRVVDYLDPYPDRHGRPSRSRTSTSPTCWATASDPCPWTWPKTTRSDGRSRPNLVGLGHLLGDDLAGRVQHVPESTVVVDCLTRGLPGHRVVYPEVQRPAVVCHLDSAVGALGRAQQIRVHSVAVDGDVIADQEQWGPRRGAGVVTRGHPGPLVGGEHVKGEAIAGHQDRAESGNGASGDFVDR